MSTSETAHNPKAQSRAGLVEVAHTRVFAAGPNGGNPCPVIPFADMLTDGQMQALARRFGLDTAFILRPQSRSADIRIRYFVPDHEMGISGHATVAAITVAWLDKVLKSEHVRVATITGTFAVECAPQSGSMLVTLEQNQPTFGPIIPPAKVAVALRLKDDLIMTGKGPIQSVSVSRSKLLIPLQDSVALNNLKPDYEALWQVCDELKITGFYPFTPNTDKPRVIAEARQFPLRAGFPEDAATGVAAAALGAYLASYHKQCRSGEHHFRIAQGYAMGAPSEIEAVAECANGKIVRTAIRGSAQVIGREHVSLHDK